MKTKPERPSSLSPTTMYKHPKSPVSRPSSASPSYKQQPIVTTSNSPVNRHQTSTPSSKPSAPNHHISLLNGVTKNTPKDVAAKDRRNNLEKLKVKTQNNLKRAESTPKAVPSQPSSMAPLSNLMTLVNTANYLAKQEKNGHKYHTINNNIYDKLDTSKKKNGVNHIDITQAKPPFLSMHHHFQSFIPPHIQKLREQNGENNFLGRPDRPLSTPALANIPPPPALLPLGLTSATAFPYTHPMLNSARPQQLARKPPQPKPNPAVRQIPNPAMLQHRMGATTSPESIKTCGEPAIKTTSLTSGRFRFY